MPDRIERICILGAMGMELRGIGKRLENLEEVPTVHGCRRGSAFGLEVFLVRTGIGKKAEEAAHCAAGALHPDAILCVGTAGGLIPELRVGDVVACPSVLGPSPDDPAMRCDGALLAAAQRAGAGEGVCLTVEKPLASPEAKAAAAARGASVCEMEAWFAARGTGPGIPFLALKAVSDARDDRLPDIARFMDSAGRVDGKRAALHFATHPADAARAARFLRDANRAVRALAETLAGMLEGMGA
jgi:nucleoside phosphorylase